MKAGRKRKVRRIQEALDQQKHEKTFSDVARKLGVSLPLVWQTAHGQANNRRVLTRFIELGVCLQDLDVPEHMRVELEEIARKEA